MVVGAAIAAGFGIVGGLATGSYIFPAGSNPKSYKYLHEAADHDDTVEFPRVEGAVPSSMRALLGYSPTWTTWPDYDKVSMVNRIVKTMWPNLDKLVMGQVLINVQPILDTIPAMVPGGILESITLDPNKCTLGTRPFRLGGVKVYRTQEDEAIMESSVLWGSDCKIVVNVRMRVGPVAIDIPVEASNLYAKGQARITFKPLVETIPCLGGLTISLLELPEFDLSLKLVQGVDLMAIPGVKLAVHMVVKMVLEGMMLYPNSFSVPIMTDYGLPPPPIGTLQVRVVSVNLPEGGLLSGKINPYVKLEVRENRGIRSSTQSGTTPDFSEEVFNLVVDDPFTQKLKLSIYDDDMGWQDTKLGSAEIYLCTTRYDAESGKDVDVEEDFIKNPKKEGLDMKIQLYKAKPTNLLAAGTMSIAKVASLGAYKGKGSKEEKEVAGSAVISIKFISFAQPTMDDDDDDTPSPLLAPTPSLVRKVEARVHHNLKGVLTVKLIRCIDLDGDGGTDAFCEMRLIDPDPSKADEVQKSHVVYNESSPRWGNKFDFVMIAATSNLVITVKDKTTAMESVMSLKVGKSRFEDKLVGIVSIPVRDIARNGRIKGIWPLGEPAKKGSIELQMDWKTCYLRD